MTRIPIEKIQELRGKLEHWRVRNRALATEARHIDRLLVTRNGVIDPRGSVRELKQAYVDFWDSLETLRIHLLTGTSISQSYCSSYSRVITIEELLSFPEVQARVVRLGSDATPARCAPVDYTNKIFSCFPYTICVEFMSGLTGLPSSDFLLIALAEFLSLLRFLISQSSRYKQKFLAYAGDNQNVVTWIKYRKPKKRLAQYFTRISNRFETENDCTVFPCYVSSGNNVFCDQLSRLGETSALEYGPSMGYEPSECVTIPKWFLPERLRTRSLVLPTDPPDRVQRIMQFVEKRTIRSIPPKSQS